jgi:hypothetical protein
MPLEFMLGKPSLKFWSNISKAHPADLQAAVGEREGRQQVQLFELIPQKTMRWYFAAKRIPKSGSLPGWRRQRKAVIPKGLS